MPRLPRPLSALAFAVLSAPLGTTRGQAPPCAARVDSVSTPLDSAVVTTMRELDVPGAALAVVRDGRVAYLHGYGCANIARGVPVDPERTVFHVASVSKPFVALAAVQLATRGTVDLHADVNRYLRDVQVPAGWNRAVTLHDLLTHTAGFEESIVGYAARTPGDIRPLGEFLRARLPARGWPPGDVTGYSNYGYALAGYVVESVTGVSFADYVQRDVLAPLGMTRSSFVQPVPAALERDAAISYRCTDDACDAIPPDYRSAYPPGGLVTTAADMSRFMLAQLGEPIDGQRILGDSILRLMHEPQFTHHPSLPGLTYGFAEDRVAGERALSHAGGASGYTSFVVLVPGQRLGAFLVANGGSSRFGARVLELLSARFAAPVRDTNAATPPVVGSGVDLAGAYRLTRYAHRGVENLPALFNGQLHVEHAGGDTIAVSGLGDANGRYVPVAPDLWRHVNGADVLGVRTRGDRVTHLFGSQSFFGTRFPAAYERLAWYDEPHFLNEALSWVVAIPLLALLSWPIIALVVWLVRRPRRGSTARVASGPPWRMAGVAAAVAFTALALWFGFGFIAVTNRAAERGGGEIVYGLPPMLQVLAWAPLAIAIATIALVAATVVGWKRQWWSVPSLLVVTVVTVNAVLFVALLVRWGYFPVATG